MLAAMRYHFRHLADFSGRDARQTFWFWFLFLFIVNIAVSLVGTVPMMIEAMTIGFEAAQSGQPEAVEAIMTERMGAYMPTMIAIGIAVGVFNMAMIAAAFVRRLHDSGKSGVWAIVAGLIYVVSLYLAWSRAGDAVELMREMSSAQGPAGMMQMQSKMAWQSLIGYVPIAMVIGFGLLKSDPGPNRFGEDPVRF